MCRFLCLGFWSSKGFTRPPPATRRFQNLHELDPTMTIPVGNCMLILRFENSNLAVMSMFPPDSPVSLLLSRCRAQSCVFMRLAATRHADNGVSTDRINSVLGGNCQCHQGNCFSKLYDMQKDLNTFLATFWALEKPAQDAYARDSFVSTHFNSLLARPFSWIGKVTVFNPKPLAPDCRQLRSMEFCLGPSQATDHGVSLGRGWAQSVWLPFWAFGVKGFNVVGLEDLINGIGALEVTPGFIWITFVHHRHMVRYSVFPTNLNLFPSGVK